MARAAFLRCVSFVPKFSMLNPAIVNSSAAGHGDRDRAHVGRRGRWRLRQDLVGAEREVERSRDVRESDVRGHRNHRRAGETVAVDHYPLRVLVEARDAAVGNARCRVRRHRQRDLDSGLAYRSRDAREHREGLAKPVGGRNRDRASRRASACLRSARVDRAFRLDRGWLVVSATAAGSAWPLDSTETSPGSELSSWVRLKNSVAVPRAVTASPTATAGAEEVNTNTACDVAGLPSPSSDVCRKNPFVFRPVTTPVVVTSRPRNGVAEPAALDLVNGRRNEVAAPRRRGAVARVGLSRPRSRRCCCRNRSTRRACAGRPACCSWPRSARSLPRRSSLRSQRDRPRCQAPGTRPQWDVVVCAAPLSPHRRTWRLLPVLSGVGRARGAARARRLLHQVVPARSNRAVEQRYRPGAGGCRSGVLHGPTRQAHAGRAAVEELDEVVCECRARVAPAAVHLTDDDGGHHRRRRIVVRDGSRLPGCR